MNYCGEIKKICEVISLTVIEKKIKGPSGLEVIYPLIEGLDKDLQEMINNIIRNLVQGLIEFQPNLRVNLIQLLGEIIFKLNERSLLNLKNVSFSKGNAKNLKSLSFEVCPEDIQTLKSLFSPTSQLFTQFMQILDDLVSASIMNGTITPPELNELSNFLSDIHG